MISRSFPVWVVAVLSFCFLNGAPAKEPAPAARAARVTKLPMRFEQNAGQLPSGAEAKFVARDGKATLFLADEGATLTLCSAKREEAATVLRMRVSGARKVTPRAEQPLITKTNYFIGKDPSRWRTDVANFGRVTYPGVLEGVDLVYHGEEGQLEYDFVVAPGVDTGRIALEIEGGEGLSLSSTGDLSMHTSRGDLVQPRPRVYQRDESGVEHDVAAQYRLVSPHVVAFELAAYDRTREVVIDPVLVYSTYLGGNGNDGINGETRIALDQNKSAYVAGRTFSTDFPTTVGAFQVAASAVGDVFVSKLNVAGNALVYSTYIGGDSVESINGIAVDFAGSAYITGWTVSSDYPTQGPVQATFGGARDAFVTKLSATGNALVYSTYLGGTGTDEARGIALGPAGEAYVAGYTESSNFPILNGFKGTLGAQDGFVTKLNATGNAFVYSTFLGGAGYEEVGGIAVDDTGHAYVAGFTNSDDFPTMNPVQAALGSPGDGFIVKLNPAASALVYGTYFGGDGTDNFNAIAIDGAGNAYATGYTVSTNLPTVNPIQAAGAGSTDVMVAKLNAAGSAFVYATYLGGMGEDSAYGIAADAFGNAYVTGYLSTDWPTMNPTQAASGGGRDAFITELNPAGSAFVFSTYYGGAGNEWATGIAVDSLGNAYVAGQTESANLPTLAPIQAVYSGTTDAFITKIGAPPVVVPPVVPPALALAPATASVAPRGSQTFVAMNAVKGGFIGVTFAIQTNASGGSINFSTGVYQAGPKGNVVDVVRVTDSTGATATASVTVSTALSITPPSASVAAGTAVAFSAAAGSNAGFAYAITLNASGATIDAASGAYTAGAFTGQDAVTVTDSLGATASAIVTVAGVDPPPGFTPSSSGNPGPGVDGGGSSAVDGGGSSADGGPGTPGSKESGEGSSSTDVPAATCGMTRTPGRDATWPALLALALISLRRRPTRRSSARPPSRVDR